jgi:uncharacterized membrane protein
MLLTGAPMYQDHSEHKIDCDVAKIIAVTSYMFFIGWFIAALVYGNHREPFIRFHLRQSLGLLITMALLTFVPLVGWLLNVVVLFLYLLAIYYACTGQKRAVPWIGDYFQQHLSFIP